MVWAESLRQAREMLDWWKNHDSNSVKSTDKDTRILSLHVLASAGFGMSYPFTSAREPPSSNFTMTYREALSLILEYILVVIAIPRILLKLPFVPKNWARASQATTEFQRYMTDMLEKEKLLISQRAPGAANLMSSLVRGSEEARQADTENDKGYNIPKGLTDSEIYGNIFLYNFAGHETTGNILTYSILLLAAHPQWQDWLAEEIEQVFGDQPYNQAWAYKQFPRLKRCLAVMVSDMSTSTF
jgi:cytochrome P450